MVYLTIMLPINSGLWDRRYFF